MVEGGTRVSPCICLPCAFCPPVLYLCAQLQICSLGGIPEGLGRGQNGLGQDDLQDCGMPADVRL